LPLSLTLVGNNRKSGANRQKPIDQLSGGWRNHSALAKILLEQPDVVLLVFESEGSVLDINGNWTIWQASAGFY
jgi:ABC-type multidrug transport system ATPase subunit